MKQGSTLLKVVSIIMIVYGIILAVLGLVSTVGGGAMIGADAETDITAAGAGLAIIGIAFIISGVLEAVIGFVGLRASKEQGEHKAAFVIGIIGVVSGAITLVQSFGGDGGSVFSSLLGLILPVLYLVGVNQTRQEA